MHFEKGTHMPSTGIIQVSFFRYQVYKDFRVGHSLTSNGLWPLPNNIEIIFCTPYSVPMFMGFIHNDFFGYQLYKVFTVLPLMTSNHHWTPPKYRSITQCGEPHMMYEIHASFISWVIIFAVWSPMTLNDLRPSPKTAGIIYSFLGIHVSRTRSQYVTREPWKWHVWMICFVDAL